MAHQTTDAARSRLMRSVKSKNTGPERAVRSLLHKHGYRFRLHRSDLPGTPDIVFPNRHKVIWVHGCFWHGHQCAKGRLPKSRLNFWVPKIEGNRARDIRKQLALNAHGWEFFVVWQCELKDREALVRKLRNFLGPPGKRTVTRSVS